MTLETQRAHIVFPVDLATQIDEIAGPRGRNAYVVETMRAAVQRERLLKFLNEPTPAWKDEDHPELAKLGSAAWLKLQRAGKSDRRKRIEKQWWNRK
jgi:hypothetical protein